MFKRLECLIFGHIPVMRFHKRSPVTNIVQVVCERCNKSFGQETIQIHDNDTLERFLVKVLPERNKKKMYKKSEDLIRQRDLLQMQHETEQLLSDMNGAL